jgi:hypothetical protein
LPFLDRGDFFRLEQPIFLLLIVRSVLAYERVFYWSRELSELEGQQWRDAQHAVDI